ncbi:uncharacterized protein LAJ45_02573 [Morchella importuna]|uniref:uncharacterized protein n=1 Tax=Morchella importuna TaxID=1174673 RepID=UPI001E8DF948|nr:uncharacterized protein LAJ45_02573 [Morchella importuna]KAH8152986.1 hypothetical protein LAJ45_02573 [Morchella importuna]
MEHFSDTDSEHHSSIVGAGYTRPATERTPNDNNESNTYQPRRNSVRERKAPIIYGYNIQHDTTLTEPTNYQQEMNNPDSEKCQNAIKVELDSLARNNTWDMVNTLDYRKLVDCKWVYKIKLGPDGNPIQYKARLVAKRFSQIPGQDFD